jgi:hypothetical protein
MLGAAHSTRSEIFSLTPTMMARTASIPERIADMILIGAQPDRINQ